MENNNKKELEELHKNDSISLSKEDLKEFEELHKNDSISLSKEDLKEFEELHKNDSISLSKEDLKELEELHENDSISLSKEDLKEFEELHENDSTNLSKEDLSTIFEELDQLNLINENGSINLSKDNLQALENGNMTDLIMLENIGKTEKVSLNARLSIINENGKNKLRIDPIQNEEPSHKLIDQETAKKLISGKIPNYLTTETKKGKTETYLIEYDKQTNQFIQQNIKDIRIPHAVNNEVLNEQMKKKLQRGEIIQLSDGTMLQYKATESKGFLSNRQTLVLSLLLDGGFSYLLIQGLKALFDRPQQDNHYSKGFFDALKCLENNKINQSFYNDPNNKPEQQKEYQEQQKEYQEDNSQKGYKR